MPRAKGVRNSDYEAKRRELLDRMLPRFVRRDIERPSLRQLAIAAGVTVPTLEHYFGRRSDVVAALLEEYRHRGARRLEILSRPSGPFAQSVREFAFGMIIGMKAGGAVRLGDVFAVSLSEGLADASVAPMSLQHIIDPAIASLSSRLDAHIAAGEMIVADTRAAAMMLISPILIAVLHQDQMGGCDTNPADLGAIAEQVSSAFVRAYAAPAP